MNIAKLMIPKLYTAFLHENDTIRQGLECFTHHGYTAIPVLNEHEQYIGSITEGDFLRHVLATGTTDLKAQERYRIKGLVRRDFCPALPIDADGRRGRRRHAGPELCAHSRRAAARSAAYSHVRPS